MKYALVITGVLASLAIAAPMLVVVGYFFLVVPGLILTFSPTAFVYLAGTAVIRRLLPISSPVAATTLALCIAIFLGWAVMQPFRTAATTAYKADVLPDVIPKQAIALDGHVRINMPDRRSEPDCDYLCLALLDSPSVRSVTMVTAGRGKQLDGRRSAAYALVTAEADPVAGLFPTDPGQIVREYPPQAKPHQGRQLIVAAKAVEANWALRLAGPDRLRKSEPVAADDADWVIRIDKQTKYPASTVERVTIHDSTGAACFRKSYVMRTVPAPIFYFGFHVHSAGGTIGSFHVGRQVMASGQRSLRLESSLLAAIDLPMPQCNAEAIVQLRDQARKAIEDPNATQVGLDLARRHLGLFFFDTTEQDHPLIARIVADDRIRGIDDQIMNIFSKEKTPVSMRNAFAERIVMDHTSASLRRWLADRLAALPSGTFADPSAAHLRIWNTPEIYQEAAPFIASLSDIDPERALPKLESMLEAAIEIPQWKKRRPLIDGIQAAYLRLGPHGSNAAPRLRELFLQRPSPIMVTSGQADQWRLTLARMGVPIEDLPFFPNQSAGTANRIRQRVTDKLRRYERDHAPVPEA